MSELLKSSLQDMNEIILQNGTYSIDIPASTVELVESISHDYKIAPFFQYKTSYDGDRWLAPFRGRYNNEYYFAIAKMYTDKDNIYFHFTYEENALASSTPSAFTLYFQYKLFLVESST